jgi:hypothetical protein
MRTTSKSVQNLRNKLAKRRIVPPGNRGLTNVHKRLNHRYICHVDTVTSGMDCDWTFNTYLKPYHNLPKVDRNGPFNTNLIVKSIRPYV